MEQCATLPNAFNVFVDRRFNHEIADENAGGNAPSQNSPKSDQEMVSSPKIPYSVSF